jgi:integrase
MPRASTPQDGRWRKTPPTLPGVHAKERRDALGPYWVFVVRWKDPVSGKRLTETCPTPQEALDFKAQLRLMRRRGNLDDLDRGRETLGEFAGRWLTQHAAQHLTRRTLKAYTTTYNKHIHPALGGAMLRDIKPLVVDQFRTALLEAGVGAPTVRKALAVLSSMLGQAVLWGRIDQNPVRSVKKPAGRRRKVIEPLSVHQVERLVHELRQLGDEDGAMLAQLMAYTGARPQDALALAYSEVTTRIHFAFKVVDGVRYEGAKTGADRSRSVEALPSLRRALLARRALAPGTTGEPARHPPQGR